MGLEGIQGGFYEKRSVEVASQLTQFYPAIEDGFVSQDAEGVKNPHQGVASESGLFQGQRRATTP